jgi:hypothetical protein
MLNIVARIRATAGVCIVIIMSPTLSEHLILFNRTPTYSRCMLLWTLAVSLILTYCCKSLYNERRGFFGVAEHR